MLVQSADQGTTDDPDCISAFDVDTAFLQGQKYGPDDRPRYVALRMYKGAPLRVFRMAGSLYGQTDASIRFYRSLRTVLEDKMGYIPGENDKCIFRHPSTGHRLVVHVDDGLSKGTRAVQEAFYTELAKHLAIKPPKWLTPDDPLTFCSMRLSMKHMDSGVTWYRLDQCDDIKLFLDECGTDYGRPVKSPMPHKSLLMKDGALLSESRATEYRSRLGSLRYFADCTRWDLAQPCARLAQQLQHPTHSNWQALEYVLSYLRTTELMGLEGPAVDFTQFDMYVDSDHAGDRDLGNRSHTGILFLCNGVPYHWRSNKQPTTAKSSAEAEIYALSVAAQDMKLSMYKAEEMGLDVKWPGLIYVDNSTGISFQNKMNPDSKLKGTFDLRDSWVKELQDGGVLKAVKVHTDSNVSDILTKCSTPTRIQQIIDLVNQRATQIAAARGDVGRLPAPHGT